MGGKVLQSRRWQEDTPIEPRTVKTRTKSANGPDLRQVPGPRYRDTCLEDGIESSLPSTEHRRERWNCELQSRVILNPNPFMIVQKGRERQRIMNIAPKKFKPRSVLKLTQATSVGSRGPTDLPHPINEGPCKTLVTNNGVDVMLNFNTDLEPTRLAVPTTTG